MNRRGFLGRFLGSAAAIASASKLELMYALEKQGIADPEAELWTPDEKKIWIPGAGQDAVVPFKADIVRPILIMHPDRYQVEISEDGRRYVEYYKNLMDKEPSKVIMRTIEFDDKRQAVHMNEFGGFGIVTHDNDGSFNGLGWKTNGGKF